jgi:hypothetical protein
MSIPKPSLSDVDETSLTLGWTPFTIPPACVAHLQYKLPHEEWNQSKFVEITGSEVKITSQVADLTPGTPYCVRIVTVNSSGGIENAGPETVFDTAPINCTPKEKKCIVS